MSSVKNLWQRLLHDIQVELTEEFDRNFERKAFFDRPWKQRRGKRSGNGSLLQATGRLRRSLRATEDPASGTVSWTSTEPYADIHNSGGSITVTRRMKQYAWHRYYELAPKIKHRKDGSLSATKRNLAIAGEAEMWYAIALMKPGSKIEIPRRQFIGNHPKVRESVARVCDKRAGELAGVVAEILKNT